MKQRKEAWKDVRYREREEPTDRRETIAEVPMFKSIQKATEDGWKEGRPVT